VIPRLGVSSTTLRAKISYNRNLKRNFLDPLDLEVPLAIIGWDCPRVSFRWKFVAGI
jgi:hypothetical protein